MFFFTFKYILTHTTMRNRTFDVGNMFVLKYLFWVCNQLHLDELKLKVYRVLVQNLPYYIITSDLLLFSTLIQKDDLSLSDETKIVFKYVLSGTLELKSFVCFLLVVKDILTFFY